MTTTPQYENHLDADQLSAFAEGALSAKERTLCLEHLAGCARCREVAFLANEALPAEQKSPSSVRRFSLAWWPSLSLAGAAIAAVVGIAVLLHHAPNPPQTPVQVADATPPQPQPNAALEPVRPQPQSPRSQPKPAQPKAPEPSKAEPATAIDSQQIENLPINGRHILNLAAPRSAPIISQGAIINNRAVPAPAGTMANAAGTAVAAAPLALPPAAPPQDAVGFTLRTDRPAKMAAIPSRDGLAQIAGVITDPSGASIPHATVVLDQASGTAHRQTTTDGTGHFSVASLPPGKYRMEVSSPGFDSTVREVELGTNELAQLNSTLNVGSTSETVEVNAGAVQVNTEQVAVGSTMPMQSTVTVGGITLGLDSTGKLQRRKNHGKWKKLRGPWKNAPITTLVLTPDQQAKVTTATGSWTSADGSHWSPAQ